MADQLCVASEGSSVLPRVDSNSTMRDTDPAGIEALQIFWMTDFPSRLISLASSYSFSIDTHPYRKFYRRLASAFKCRPKKWSWKHFQKFEFYGRIFVVSYDFSWIFYVNLWGNLLFLFVYFNNFLFIIYKKFDFAFEKKFRLKSTPNT